MPCSALHFRYYSQKQKMIIYVIYNIKNISSFCEVVFKNYTHFISNFVRRNKNLNKFENVIAYEGKRSEILVKFFSFEWRG